jgi:anti-sigma regulatory factor (Ser/Thr protein kinase)
VSDTQANTIEIEPNTQGIEYACPLQPPPDEDVIWRKIISPHLTGISQNVLRICQYGFTEIVNNAIEHSGSKTLKIKLSQNGEIRFSIIDYGVGIFTKIKDDFGLEEPDHAMLELIKGKLTSDPRQHSGEGIFFTSRIFDTFTVASGSLQFSWIKNGGRFEFSNIENGPGTTVTMAISVDSKLSLTNIFNEYADPDKQPGFYKTSVPLQIMQHEGESLMSRSQARRLANRFDRFLEVVLDFTGVDFIGQSFADEIFRVFAQAHPGTRLVPVNCTETVERMIAHVGGIKQK